MYQRQSIFFAALILIAQQATFVRTDCINGNYYNHETSCERFYQCSNGEKIELTCYAGLHFNPNINVCDYPENVMCEITSESTVTDEPSTEPASETTSRRTTEQPATTEELTTVEEESTTRRGRPSTESPATTTRRQRP